MGEGPSGGRRPGDSQTGGAVVSYGPHCTLHLRHPHAVQTQTQAVVVGWREQSGPGMNWLRDNWDLYPVLSSQASLPLGPWDASIRGRHSPLGLGFSGTAQLGHSRAEGLQVVIWAPAAGEWEERLQTPPAVSALASPQTCCVPISHFPMPSTFLPRCPSNLCPTVVPLQSPAL